MSDLNISPESKSLEQGEKVDYRSYVVDVESSKDARVVDLGAQAHYEAIEFTEEESNAVLRKIDLRIIPMVVFLCMLKELGPRWLS